MTRKLLWGLVILLMLQMSGGCGARRKPAHFVFYGGRTFCQFEEEKRIEGPSRREMMERERLREEGRQLIPSDSMLAAAKRK